VVRLEGGLVPPGVILNRAPLYTLYGDGRLIFEAPPPPAWPGPLLPALLQVNIGADGLEAVLDAVHAVNLPRITELFNSDGINQVADGPNTVVTYFDDAGEHIFSVYALHIAEQKDPQVRLLADLVNVLDRLAAESPSARPVEVERFQVLANSQTANPDDPLSVVEAWPLSISPARMTELDFAIRCAVIEVGEDPEASQAFQAAHQMTFFEHDGMTYRFTVRPLLVGETGCIPLSR
jgi:hypothetical protein